MLNELFVWLLNSLPLAAPLILAALAGLFSERSGVIDISLEGKMLTSACIGAWVAGGTHSALIGLAGGVGAAILLSTLHWLFTQHYRIDHVVSGMALNALALGATNFINTKFLSTAGEIPQVPKLPVHFAGATAFISLYVMLAFAAPFAVSSFITRTRWGLRLLAVGNSPGKSRLAGLSPVRIRWGAALVNGCLTGVAGVLIVDNAGRFTDNMTAGRGYIALAALIIGGWRSLPALLACVVFGLFDALQIALQGRSIAGIQAPPELWLSMPYLAAVLALAGLVKRSRPPAGLGQH
ncbi:MAG TPA: ABC transporter permease [Fimbriimonadaceae bacterium]|nr:ABC transporter permease [Fimbriimonadaceae bacterium]